MCWPFSRDFFIFEPLLCSIEDVAATVEHPCGGGDVSIHMLEHLDRVAVFFLELSFFEGFEGEVQLGVEGSDARSERGAACPCEVVACPCEVVAGARGSLFYGGGERVMLRDMHIGNAAAASQRGVGADDLLDQLAGDFLFSSGGKVCAHPDISVEVFQLGDIPGPLIFVEQVDGGPCHIFFQGWDGLGGSGLSSVQILSDEGTGEQADVFGAA